ncbi:MAG TPA: type II toxin-antitoxin system HicB family antitoxin [Pyrinomonadaceae bacterium]|nr:type II toxin-antitoxin system HicB family antitoxin [Pyrinomonadaceae bacterium]
MNDFKIIIEKHEDGFVAYPLGLKGVVVGQGDSYEGALADIKSATRFHIETFGDEVFETDSPVLETFVAETPNNFRPARCCVNPTVEKSRNIYQSELKYD